MTNPSAAVSTGRKRAHAGDQAVKGTNRAPREKDPPLLKAQKAAATQDILELLTHYLRMTPIELEVALKTGRPKKSKDVSPGPSGDKFRRYLAGEAAANVNLAGLMFTAVEKGLFDPSRTVEYCQTPGISRAVLPVRRLLLKLAIEGRGNATEQEASTARKAYQRSHAAKLKQQKNERDRFAGWKKSVDKRLLRLIVQLTTMKHYAWSATHPASLRLTDLDGYLDVAPQQRFADDIQLIVQQVRGLELDPMYMLNADLPIDPDTAEEKAEIQKQLTAYLARREAQELCFKARVVPASGNDKLAQPQMLI